MKQNQSPVLKAVLWMLGALTSFMMIGIGGRELSRELGTFQILFFRSVIGLIVVSILLSSTNWQQIKTQQFKRHVWRNLAHYGGQFGWFFGISVMPLAEVFALEFTVPIWVTFLAPLFLGEKFTRGRLTAVIIGFMGVLIILRPGIAVINPAAFTVLGAALGYAISTIFTKKLAATESPVSIIFYMTIIQLPLGFFPALINWATPSISLWPWLVIVGIGALSAHYCMTKALTLIDATIVAPMDFLRLPLAAIVGFLFYAEPLSWFVIIGGGVMVLGNLINIRAEQNQMTQS